MSLFMCAKEINTFSVCQRSLVSAAPDWKRCMAFGMCVRRRHEFVFNSFTLHDVSIIVIVHLVIC